MWVVVKASVQLLMVIIALVVTVILDNADHFGVAGGGAYAPIAPPHPRGYGPVKLVYFCAIQL